MKEETSDAIIEAPELTLKNVQEIWSQVVKEASPPSVKMSLKNGRVKAVGEKKVTLMFDAAFHKDKVAQTDASRGVEEIMERIFKRSLKLECILESEGDVDSAPSEDAVSLVEAAAEIF